jgi:hypothetical protein
MISLAKTLLELMIPPQSVLASHQRLYELLFLNAIKIAKALPNIAAIEKGNEIAVTPCLCKAKTVTAIVLAVINSVLTY